jgi:hypothetical protein
MALLGILSRAPSDILSKFFFAGVIPLASNNHLNSPEGMRDRDSMKSKGNLEIFVHFASFR